MRSHGLSRLSKKDGQSMFSTKRKKKEKKSNQNHKNRKECHEHYTFFMIQSLFALLAFQDEDCMHLHPINHVHIRL